MVEEIRKSLFQVLSSVEGLLAIVITDRDGVTILKANLDSAPEMALRMNFLSTFANSTDQASKLGMGKNNQIISMFQNHQVIQINKMPIVITLIAKIDANTGYLLTLQDRLDPLVQEIKDIAKEQ